jgi:hypothetical protein
MGIRKRAVEFGDAVGDQSLTVSSTAVGLTIPSGAVSALLTNGAEPIRLRWGTPTASVGHYLAPYTSIELFNDKSDVKLIRVSSDSTVFVTYYGP